MEVLKLAFDLDLVSVVGMDVVIMAVRTIISIITDLLTIVRIDPITINHRHITNNRTITITTISRSIEAACTLVTRKKFGVWAKGQPPALGAGHRVSSILTTPIVLGK